MMKSIILGLFAIFAMNFGFTESKVEISDAVLKNAEVLEIRSLPVSCKTCVGNKYTGCFETIDEEGELIVVGCPGVKKRIIVS